MQTLKQIEISREILWLRKQALEGKAWRAFQNGHWAVLARVASQVKCLDMLIRELDWVMDAGEAPPERGAGAEDVAPQPKE